MHKGQDSCHCGTSPKVCGGGVVSVGDGAVGNTLEEETKEHRGQS